MRGTSALYRAGMIGATRQQEPQVSPSKKPRRCGFAEVLSYETIDNTRTGI